MVSLYLECEECCHKFHMAEARAIDFEHNTVDCPCCGDSTTVPAESIAQVRLMLHQFKAVTDWFIT